MGLNIVVNAPVFVPLNLNLNPQINTAVGFNVGVSVFGDVGNQSVGQAQGNQNNTAQVGLFANSPIFN